VPLVPSTLSAATASCTFVLVDVVAASMSGIGSVGAGERARGCTKVCGAMGKGLTVVVACPEPVEVASPRTSPVDVAVDVACREFIEELLLPPPPLD